MCSAGWQFTTVVLARVTVGPLDRLARATLVAVDAIRNAWRFTGTSSCPPAGGRGGTGRRLDVPRGTNPNSSGGRAKISVRGRR